MGGVDYKRDSEAMKAKPPKDRKKRSYAVRNYIPQPEDFYGLYKLYEFQAMQAANPKLWDEMMAHQEANGDVKADKFDVPERTAQKHLRTYRERSSTVPAILTLHLLGMSAGNTERHPNLIDKTIESELGLKKSYIESVIDSWKPLPEDPAEVVPHFPLEFNMWCPPGLGLQIYWKHNPARSLSQKKRQDAYIAKLKEDNFPNQEILWVYKLGFRLGSNRLMGCLDEAARKNQLPGVRRSHPDNWKALIELNLGNVEVLMLTDSMIKGTASEEDERRHEELVVQRQSYEDDFFGYDRSTEKTEEAPVDLTVEEQLLALMEMARIQRVCHLLQIEVKHLKVPKSLVVAMA